MARARSNSDFLWIRAGSSMVWFSRWVPKEFRHLESRNPIQFSLQTTDRKEAAVKARKIAAEQDARWRSQTPTSGSAIQLRAVSDADLDEAVVISAHELVLEEAQDGMRNLRGKGENLWHGQLNWIAQDVREQARLTATGDFSAVEAEAQAIVEALGPVTGEQYQRICDQLNRVKLDALRLKAKRAAGDLSADTGDELVRSVRQRRAGRPKPGETLEELFERWAEECLAKNEKRPDTVEQDRKVLRQFAKFVGEDRAVDSITALDVAEFRDISLSLPPRWKSKKELRHLDIRSAASRARELGMPRTSYTTVNKFLSTISPLYKWLARQPAWAGLRNPCDGLFHTKVKGKNPRPPFTTAQLNAILTSPLFTGFQADGNEHVPGKNIATDWRRWVLLLCMFTGARVGEVAQLRVGDIREQGGIWLMQITEEENAGLTSKNRKSHIVPLHSNLLARRFLDFVADQRRGRGDQKPLFSGLERDARGQYGKVARWYRDYLEAIGIKQGRDGVGMHSFRHTIADRMRTEASLLDNEIGIFLNHSMRSTTGGYGRISQATLAMMRDWIEAVTWDGVDFSAI